jgi:hypothetical protein
MRVRFEYREERPTMWQVAIDGEEVNVWQGEEAGIATAVLDLYALLPPWQIEEPAICYRTLEAALRLYHLLVVATMKLVAAGASNWAVPGPLAPLVKHLGRSTGKCLSPKVFRAAAEAGLAIVVLCKGFTSVEGLEQAFGVVSLLRYSPQRSTRLVRPLGSGTGKGSQKDVSGGELKAAVKDGAKGKAVVGTSTSNPQTATSGGGTDKSDEQSTRMIGGHDGLREEEKAAAAEEAAFVFLGTSLVPEAECLRLGGKLALTAAEVVFG